MLDTLYPGFINMQPGRGVIGLHPREAAFVQHVLDDDQKFFGAAGYTRRELPAGSLDPAGIALRACQTKRTREAYKDEPIIAFEAPYDQDECDDIMREMYQMPMMSCWAQHLEHDLGYAIGTPSPELTAFAKLPETPTTGHIYGDSETIAYVAWTLAKKLGVNASWRHRLTPDERITAERLIAESHKQTNGYYVDDYTLGVLDVPRNQNACDELTRAIHCAPFLPESIVCEAHFHGVGDDNLGIDLDELRNAMPIFSAVDDDPTLPSAEEADRAFKAFKAFAKKPL